jgi:Spy/CpxP family protein refolding chaperone
MFGISAFCETPFASIPSAATPVPIELPIGGHFGFDEKKRDAEWAKDRKLEAQRKQKLKEAIFGLPPEVREEITSAPEQTIDIAVRKQIDYDSLMQKVKTLENKVRLKRDEEDIAMILEMM